MNEQPVQLVRAQADPTPAPWPITDWWVLGPVLIVGAVVLLTLQIRSIRRRRLSDSERAFRRIASHQRLPAGARLITRELATAHGRATPVALLLSDHALREAAARLDPKPGSSRERAMNKLLRRRGLVAAG
ncbi:MAG: hypothetical protein H6810_10220 [Phycisphaeraceae bacterium]|nr:MAG: hypothetical protein H6810_10220 [Phycisphaeraceae bacterium]